MASIGTLSVRPYPAALHHNLPEDLDGRLDFEHGRPEMWRRKLKLEAKFESGSSYFSFNRRNQARSTQGQPGVNPGSTWSQVRVNLGSTQGQPGVNPGSTWGQPRVNLGTTQGQPGVNPGSTWGQPRVNLGSTYTALPRSNSASGPRASQYVITCPRSRSISLSVISRSSSPLSSLSWSLSSLFSALRRLMMSVGSTSLQQGH